MYEKYNAAKPGEGGGGGEYEPQAHGRLLPDNGVPRSDISHVLQRLPDLLKKDEKVVLNTLGPLHWHT